MQTFTVGRGDESDVVIIDKSISRQHLKVDILSSTQVSLQDLNSTNGSYILRQLGRSSLSQAQVASVSDKLLLGTYEITVAELLRLLTNSSPAQVVNDSSNTETAAQPQSQQNFSRYIRMENGQLVRKP